MSMSTHVIGFVPPDDTFKKMKNIWDTCTEMNISPPNEVGDFFNDCPPDDRGVEIEIPYSNWNDNDMCSGVEIELVAIPKDVKFVRFYNSW
jgi:hypothetical protein